MRIEERIGVIQILLRKKQTNNFTSYITGLVFSCQFACVHIYMQWIFQITLVRVVTTMYGRCDFIFTFICYIFFVAVSSYFSSYCFVILLVLHLPNVVPFEWMRKTFIDYRQHFPLCYHLFVPIFVNIPIYITIIF